MQTKTELDKGHNPNIKSKNSIMSETNVSIFKTKLKSLIKYQNDTRIKNLYS